MLSIVFKWPFFIFSYFFSLFIMVIMLQLWVLSSPYISAILFLSLVVLFSCYTCTTNIPTWRKCVCIPVYENNARVLAYFHHYWQYLYFLSTKIIFWNVFFSGLFNKYKSCAAILYYNDENVASHLLRLTSKFPCQTRPMLLHIIKICFKFSCIFSSCQDMIIFFCKQARTCCFIFNTLGKH